MNRLSARRRFLQGGAAALALPLVRLAPAAGRVEEGVYRVRGEAWLNGVPLQPGMRVRPGDAIRTGAASELVYVIGRDAMLVRAAAELELAGERDALAASGLRILTGAVLSVFAPGVRRRIQTHTATIGIRGTGIYVEAYDARTYVCTCYGVVDIAPLDDPARAETVRTQHHEAPRFVLARGALVHAPVINHSDAELTLLESLVGRKPPFVTSGYRPGAY